MPRLAPLSRSAAWRAIRSFTVGADGISGAAFVELAVCLPLVVALGIYAMDMGLLAYNKMEVQHAAQAGAQYAIVNNSYTASAISSAITNATTFQTVTPSSREFCGCASTTRVNFCS